MVLCVIPARYGSQRLPGKPLIKVNDLPLVMWTYNRACESEAFDRVLVATDDQRIYDAVQTSGGEAIMTASSHISGTDRAWEVAQQIKCDYLVNLQGDEPETPVELLQDFSRNLHRIDNNSLLSCVSNATIIEKNDPNVVKTVLNCRDEALYFSRSPIPFEREGNESIVYKHIGIYGFTKESLEQFCSFPHGKLEQIEKLEQLRALEYGMSVLCLVRNHETQGIDTMKDLEAFRKRQS